MSTNMTRVLLVDDDPTLRRLLKKWLSSAGYEVQQASDGAEAIDAIRHECPHILVTDWKMPRLDGLQLCRWLRKQQLPNYVYTLLLTAHGGSENTVGGLDAGADDFLVKPVHERELLARLGAATRLFELESRLKHLAGSDPLTGLLTQTTFFQRATEEWKRAARHDRNLSCVMLDLDFFKRINDTHGHAVGNDVIRCVSEILSDNCRGSDLLARYGGEEFCVLLPETDERQAGIWAERVRTIISSIRIPVGSQQIRITASLGVAQRLDDTNGPNELVDMADQAMLVAKRSGRDCIIGYQTLNQPLPTMTNETGQGAMFSGLAARDVMTTVIAGLHQDEGIVRGAMYLLGLRINSAPVVDDEGKLVGILSEKDIMSIVLWPKWWTVRIKEVMKRNVICYEEETPVLAIYDFLCRVTIRRVIVVKDNRPTGVISRGSLLSWFVNSLAAGLPHAPGDNTQPKESVWSRYRESLAKTAKALIDQASSLENRLAVEEVEFVPCLVGDASRMQELVNDLLSYSRFARDSEDATDLQLFFPTEDQLSQFQDSPL